MKHTDNALTGSTLKALDVLEHIASCGDAAGVTEISKRLGLDKSTTYRILNTLEHRGYAVQDTLTRKYRLGVKIMELSRLASTQSMLKNVAGPTLDRLARECHETLHLGIMDRGEVFHLDSREPSQLTRMVSHIGLRNPVHCTALGKVMLAFLPEEEIEQIIGKENGLRRYTKYTIHTRTELKKELQNIKKSGYAVDNEELHEGTRCLAAPLRDHEGKVIAAISLSGPAIRLTLTQLKKLRPKILTAAVEISRGLGYSAKKDKPEEK